MNSDTKELILDLLDDEINEFKHREFNGRSESQYKAFDKMNKQGISDCEKAKAEVEGMSEWISVDDRLPEREDSSVLAYFGNGGIDMVHIHDYFDDITAGINDKGSQLYTKWYKTAGVTHWHPLPSPPQ